MSASQALLPAIGLPTERRLFLNDAIKLTADYLAQKKKKVLRLEQLMQ